MSKNQSTTTAAGDMMIEQRFSYDCMVASLAMYLGTTWEEVFSELGCPEEGIRCSDAAKYLWDKGHDVVWKEAAMPRTKAIISVFSINHPSGWHAIYFDGENFFDPSPRTKFESLEQIKKRLCGVLEVELAKEKPHGGESEG